MSDTLSLGFVSNKKATSNITNSQGFIRNRKPAPGPVDSRSARKPPLKQRSVPNISSLVAVAPTQDQVATKHQEYNDKIVKQHKTRIDALNSQLDEVVEDADCVRTAVKEDLSRMLNLTNVMYGHTCAPCPSAIIESRDPTGEPPEEFGDFIPADTWCLLVYPMVKHGDRTSIRCKMVDADTGQLHWVWATVEDGKGRYVDRFSTMPA